MFSFETMIWWIAIAGTAMGIIALLAQQFLLKFIRTKFPTVKVRATFTDRLAVFGFFCILSMVFTFALIARKSQGDIWVFDMNGKLLFETPEGVLAWEKSLPKGIIFPKDDWSFTCRPKIGLVVYEVEVSFSGEIRDASAYAKAFSTPPVWVPEDSYGHWSASKKAKDHVELLLYDLHENRSLDLAKFYNPKRPEQQNQFEQIVIEEIQDDLERVGLMLEKARFSLP